MATSDLLSAVEAQFKERVEEEGATNLRLPSAAQEAPPAPRLDQIILADEKRARMPYTRDRYIIHEDPQLVEWEREVRKFLRNLTPREGHRVAAVHIWEWATGWDVKAFIEAGGAPSPDLRRINRLLGEYFGKPYSTYIMGRKIPRCYRVPLGHRIKRKRPRTLTLYAEWEAGTLAI